MSDTTFKNEASYQQFRGLWAIADALCMQPGHSFLTILLAFDSAMTNLWAIAHRDGENLGTEWVNRNPITRLYANLLVQMTGGVTGDDYTVPSLGTVKFLMKRIAAKNVERDGQLPWLLNEWQYAVDLQNACNVSGIVHRWTDFFRQLESSINFLPIRPEDQVYYLARNPVCALYADKVRDLTGPLQESDRYPDAANNLEQNNA